MRFLHSTPDGKLHIRATMDEPPGSLVTEHRAGGPLQISYVGLADFLTRFTALL